MPRITLNEIAALQTQTDNIRNVCFLAHVDHGKTTLSDHLISWNGIISSKNAGNLRYLDSRADEQERQITMKASSISLVYMPRKAKLPFLVNLVDSPGHVDFSNEASTAVRLCDGALVLVDVLEGICVQTISVLKQAWSECVVPILVLNKMDRLKIELNMNAMEAYVHIDKLIGRINALVSTFATGQAFKKIHEQHSEHPHSEKKKNLHIADDDGNKKVIDTSEYTVKLDEESEWFFSPNKGNVIFCSAKHKWGFTIQSVAQYYHSRKKMNRKVLINALWGNYYFYKNNIHKKGYKHHILPMFVEFILEPIWGIYEDVYVNYNGQQFKKWMKKLKISIPLREIDNHKDNLHKLVALMSRWMCISSAVLDAVIQQLPSPKQAQQERLDKIWNIKHLPQELINALQSCDASYKDCVLYLPKMVYVARREIESALNVEDNKRIIHRTQYKKGKYKELKQTNVCVNDVINYIINKAVLVASTNKSEMKTNNTCEPLAILSENNDSKVVDVSHIWRSFMEPGNENENGLFIGVGRIYCGTLSEKSDIHVFGARHYDGDLDHYVISGYKLFQFMGKDIAPISSLPCGNICGVGGIDNYLQKSGFLTTNVTHAPMVRRIAGSCMSYPVVRVAVEAAKYKELGDLALGLKLLNKCDTGLEILVQSNGEYVICASGELHLERCIRDLNETFARNVKLNVSEPIVSFKETVVNKKRRSGGNKNKNTSYAETMFGKRYNDRKISKEVVLKNNIKLTFQIEAVSLKKKLIEFIENNKDLICDLIHFRNNNLKYENNDDVIFKFKQFKTDLNDKLSSKMDINDVVSFGPRLMGANILFIKSKIITNKHCGLFYRLDADENECKDNSNNLLFNLISQAMQNAFQSVTLKGPLCGEPMYGVAFLIDNIQIDNMDDMDNMTDTRLVTTTIMRSVGDGCIDSFVSSSPRLVEPMYRVFIQGTSDVLGSIYDVIQKRKGKITGDSIVEGTNLFDIYSLLPVVQSFGFCDELRTQTAGNVVPQLTFSHWSIIDQDPLYVDDISNDDNMNKKNEYVKKLILNVRKRKGLETNEKTVESAEKQSNLSRKK